MSGELGPPGDPPDDDRGHERCNKCHAILDPESPFCPDCVVVVLVCEPDSPNFSEEGGTTVPLQSSVTLEVPPGRYSSAAEMVAAAILALDDLDDVVTAALRIAAGRGARPEASPLRDTLQAILRLHDEAEAGADPAYASVLVSDQVAGLARAALEDDEGRDGG